MRNSLLSKVGFATLLFVVGLWVWISVFDREADVSKTAEVASTPAEGGVGIRELAADGAILDYRGSELREGDPFFAEIAMIPSVWVERYPEGEVVEERLVRIGEGRYRRQLLLATGSARIPWVVWEDKLNDFDAGELRLVGSGARMANVFSVDANPDRVSAEALADFTGRHGLFVEKRSVFSDTVCLGFEGPALGKLEELMAAFEQAFPEVLVEFETLSYPSALPSDWNAARMWGLDNIGAPDAWEFETGSSSGEVVVAILDTGLQRTHPDIVANLWVNPNDAATIELAGDISGWDFADNDADPQDNDGHGTHVAGIVGAAGNNGGGAVGVCWNVKVLPLKVGEADGLRTTAINDALGYVRRLRDAGVNIVATNNSYGTGTASSSTRNEIVEHQFDEILFVAAAGNDAKNLDANADSQEYPAGYPMSNVISVANSNQEDGRSLSSNYGEVSVDIAAPGSDIYSLYPDGSYQFLSGTSMASPMVAGALALLASAEPELSGGELKQRLMDTGKPVAAQDGLTVSGRRLDLLAALRPDLQGHELKVTNVADALVIMDSVLSHPRFETLALPAAQVSASVVEGEGQIVDLGDGVFRFSTAVEGRTRVRFSAALGGIVRTVEKTIFLGDAADVAGGLLHHFDFDGSGSTVVDLAGSSNGTLTGANRVASEFGTSLNLDAASEQMTFSGKFSNRVTISALVRADNMGSSPHPRIVNMPFYYLYFSSEAVGDVPDGNRQTLKFYSNFDEPNNDSQISDYGVWNSPPHTIVEGQWYYVVGTYDSGEVTNSPRLFINGEEMAAFMQQEPLGSIISTGGVSYVGNNEAGDRDFDGLMADIRIYNRELSSTEIERLAVSQVQDKWSTFSVMGADRPVTEAALDYSIQDSLGRGSVREVKWYVDSDLGSSVVAAAGDSASIRFDGIGEYRLQAQVSDGLTTRLFSKVVIAEVETRQAGFYSGTTSGGGLVWLEIDEDLMNGSLSVFDPETGFYRIEEPVVIDDFGRFESSAAAKGQLSGVVSTSLFGEAAGYEVSFTAEQQSLPSSGSAFAGDFVGGGIDTPGDRVRLRVLEDGRTFVWRSGLRADLAIGSVDAQGTFHAVGATGSALDFAIDLEEDRGFGHWGAENVFLKRVGVPLQSEFLAGAVGGYPSGSGRRGVYAEFIGMGEAASERLQEGRFGDRPLGDLEDGPLVVLSPVGGSQRGEALDGLSLEEAFAELEASDALDLRQVPVTGIRAQVPLGPNGSGAVAFAILGNEPREILVRGLGPSFVSGGAADPIIQIYELVDGVAFPLAPNDDWREGTLFTGENESAQGAFRGLVSAFAELELSTLDDGAKDSAQRVWLDAGNYLVVMRLESGEPGSGLIEVFEL